MQKPANYIEPNDFFRETVQCLKKDEISNELGRMFQLLAERFVNHPKFVRYHHIRDDLISCAVMACIKGFPKFRPYRNSIERDENGEILTSTPVEWNGEVVDYDYKTCNNPFAFFTTCSHNEILQFLKSEYNQRNINNKMKLEFGLDADEGYLDMIRETTRQKKEEVDGDLDSSDESVYLWEDIQEVEDGDEAEWPK